MLLLIYPAMTHLEINQKSGTNKYLITLHFLVCRCGSQKCEELKVFFCFLFLYIFFSILSFTLHQKITIRLNNWTLRFNSPLVTTEASLEHTWINSYPTMDNISQGFHPSLHIVEILNSARKRLRAKKGGYLFWERLQKNECENQCILFLVASLF
jgi:hypothetical protein